MVGTWMPAIDLALQLTFLADVWPIKISRLALLRILRTYYYLRFHCPYFVFIWFIFVVPSSKSPLQGFTSDIQRKVLCFSGDYVKCLIVKKGMSKTLHIRGTALWQSILCSGGLIQRVVDVITQPCSHNKNISRSIQQRQRTIHPELHNHRNYGAYRPLKEDRTKGLPKHQEPEKQEQKQR
jgi:hypothetical protein